MIDTKVLGRFGAYRRLMGLGRRVEGPPEGPIGRVLCVASGKGGTGKSILATNVALLRAAAGERVCLIDFDAGLANAHLLLGLAPQHDLSHVMEGEIGAQEALVEGPHGLRLLSGGVGRLVLTNPTRRELERLFRALEALESRFDLLVIDHGAGLGYTMTTHLAAATTMLLVTSHEVTALSDAYALYKRAHLVNPHIQVGFVVNRSPDEATARSAWQRFRGAAQRFLGHSPEFVGFVPADPSVPRSVDERLPVTILDPDSSASRAIASVARWGPIDHARGERTFFERARLSLR
jgi:flagellar biosynthesis protein FlhG